MAGSTQEVESRWGKLLKRFWGRCISEVWDYFRFEVDDKGQYLQKNFTVCLLCGLEMKYCGNTTNMSNHLDRKHPGCRNLKKSDVDDLKDRVIKQEEDEKNILNNLVDAYAEDVLTCSVEVHNQDVKVKEEKSKLLADDENVRIFKSFWGDTSDSVWDYFKFEVGENGQYVDVNTVHCSLCDSNLPFHAPTGSTSHLIVHLDSVHPGYRTVQVKQEKEEVATPSTSQEEEMVKRLVEQCSREIKEGGSKSELKVSSKVDKPHTMHNGKYFKEFWGKVTSAVWQYFKFETDKDGNYLDKDTLHCMLCDTKLKYCHNTTNMAHHLERRHNIRKFNGTEHFRHLIEKLPTTSTPRKYYTKTTNTPGKHYSKSPSTVRIPSVYMKSFTNKRFQEDGDIVIDDSTQYKSFWGHASSPVWKHFKFEVDQQGNYVDKMAAYCTLCGLRMRYFQSTSNLAQHLRRKHFEEYFGPYELVDPPEVSIPSPVQQPKPNVAKCDSEKEARISAAIANHFIADVRPISNIDSPSFQEMCEAMCPEYVVPSRKRFEADILTPLYNEKKAKILHELSAAICHCVTVDWWKSDLKLNYGSVLVQYFNEAWDLKSHTLLTFMLQDRPKPQELGALLSHMAKEWRLINPILLSDNSYVMKAAATNVLQWPTVPTLDHTVDMAVLKVLSVPDIHQFLSKIKNMFSQLKQVAHCVQIQQKQARMCLPTKDLLQEFGDHWSCVLDMLVLFMEQEQVFKSIVIDCSLDEALLLTPATLTRVRELIQILDVLRMATAYLTPDRSHTLSVIMPITIKLKGCLRQAHGDSEFVVLVKSTMLTVIEESYSGESVQMLMKTASALDPRMKKLAFLTETDRKKIHQKLCQEAVSLASEGLKREQGDGSHGVSVEKPDSDDEEPKAKVVRTEDVSISDWLGDIVSVRGSSLTITQQVENELKLFITEQDITFDDSPLHWWQRRWQMYTLLSPVAKKYMCVSATSIDSVNPSMKTKRSCLESDVVDIQLFLALNK